MVSLFFNAGVGVSKCFWNELPMANFPFWLQVRNCGAENLPCALFFFTFHRRTLFGHVNFGGIHMFALPCDGKGSAHHACWVPDKWGCAWWLDYLFCLNLVWESFFFLDLFICLLREMLIPLLIELWNYLLQKRGLLDTSKAGQSEPIHLEAWANSWPRCFLIPHSCILSFVF